MRTFEDYFAAKAGLFTRVLPDDGVAVINLDDRATGRRSRGRGAGARPGGADRRRTPRRNLRIRAQRFDATGQELRFDWKAKPHQVRLDLIGGFQAENVLVAAGLVIASGCEPARGVRHAARTDHGARPDAAGGAARATARRCSSIMPIRPTRWRPR